MLMHVPNVLTAAQVAECRAVVDAGAWADGNATAGHIAAQVTHNDQLPETAAAARQAGEMVRQAVLAHPLFVAAALPHRVYPPMFNSYGPGQQFGNQRTRPLPGAAKLQDVQPIVIGFDDRGQRPAFAQRHDVAGDVDGSHARPMPARVRLP